MTKRETYAFTRKVYKCLKNPDFTLRLRTMRDFHGLCFMGDNRIQLNPRGEILSTLIHEFVHEFNHKWSETKVLKAESAIMRQLSHRQMINLMRAMVDALDRCH
jgi:hypothetical protein